MKYITSLEDIAPLVDQVVVRGNKIVQVSALGLHQIGALIYKHQALKSLFDGDAETSLFDAIMSGGAQVVCDFVDSATGISGIGARLSGVEQGNIILACLNMTLPTDEKEMSDFLDQIAAFAPLATALVGQAAKRVG